jgi:chemotaxis protein MotB
VAEGRKSRSKKKGKEMGGAGWEVIYSGFVLILLCFFIMLSSFASVEEGRVMRFVRSFVEAVSILPGGLKFEEGDEIVNFRADMVDKNSAIAAVSQNIQGVAKRMGVEGQVELHLTRKGLIMRIEDSLLFDLGIADISSEALIFLSRVGLLIAGTDYTVRIEGHTDNVPIHNDRFDSNWELSTARAVNVLKFFLEKANIPAHRLFAVGYAEYRPLVPNDSPENRARNRRVEVVLVQAPGPEKEKGDGK